MTGPDGPDDAPRDGANGGARGVSRAETLGALWLAGTGRLTLGPVADPARRVAGVAVDSRKVVPGDVFVAVPGGQLDGAGFASDAIERGAVAVVATLEGAVRIRETLGGFPVPVIVSNDPRSELARLAGAFHGAQPSVVGAVTGTNGKTSVASFLAQLWQAEGRPAAAFGTTGVTGPGFDEPLAHTTPEPVALHALLARLAARGCTHAAMEASSHGLVQHRLDGVRIGVAGFTNLTRDHLDYHPDAQSYLAAKLRLFAHCLPEDAPAAANADDPAFPLLAEIAVARRQRLIPVGRQAAEGLRLLESQFHNEGQRLQFAYAGRRYAAELKLIGGFQAENVLLAAAMAIGSGSDPEMVFVNLTVLTGVRGRMEEVARRANGAGVYVDYAHTPGALETAIAALRPHCAGRLIVVFGAGGDRDPGKRPLMGAAVAAGADHGIVTDDNPRSEEPAEIRRQVMAGCPEAEEIGDRAEAILAGVDALKAPGDCLLIAGKGHETGQMIGGTNYPFDDAEQAQVAVAVLDGDGV